MLENYEVLSFVFVSTDLSEIKHEKKTGESKYDLKYDAW